MNKRFPYEIPTGWFQVRPIRCFGQELVLFRTESGLAHLFDAYCAHLGAHLGHGGRVESERLACPFHAWEFESSGRCVHVPYAARQPRRGAVRAWTLMCTARPGCTRPSPSALGLGAARSRSSLDEVVESGKSGVHFVRRRGPGRSWQWYRHPPPGCLGGVRTRLPVSAYAGQAASPVELAGTPASHPTFRGCRDAPATAPDPCRRAGPFVRDQPRSQSAAGPNAPRRTLKSIGGGPEACTTGRLLDTSRGRQHSDRVPGSLGPGFDCHCPTSSETVTWSFETRTGGLLHTVRGGVDADRA